MAKKKIWGILTVVAAFTLMGAVAPEVRAMGLLIELIGLDMFLMLFEIQILLIVASFHERMLKPALLRINSVFDRLDPFYFAPSIANIRACPPIIMHSVPFLVSSYLIVFVGMAAYS